MADLPTLKGSWPWPWIGSYCIPSCITRQPLPTYRISLKSKKLFVDGWMDVQTYGRTFETHFIRSTRRSGPNKVRKRKTPALRSTYKNHDVARMYHWLKNEWMYVVLHETDYDSYVHLTVKWEMTDEKTSFSKPPHAVLSTGRCSGVLSVPQ